MAIELTPVILDNHRRGDSWDGMVVGPITLNEIQPPYALASARLQFRDSSDNLGYEFNTDPAAGEGRITIVDAPNWQSAVPLQVFPLEVGKWNWDYEVTDENGDVYTVAYGRIKIIEDYSHD